MWKKSENLKDRHQKHKKTRFLERKTWVYKSKGDVFDFFSDASNLELVTPSWLNFNILTPHPIKMETGTQISYRLRLIGIPVYWLTQITLWDPPNRFIDEQVSGPYHLWVHEHNFEEQSGGTLMTDRVGYVVPGSLLEPLIHFLFVKPSLNKIFAYREERFRQLIEERTDRNQKGIPLNAHKKCELENPE